MTGWRSVSGWRLIIVTDEIFKYTSIREHVEYYACMVWLHTLPTCDRTCMIIFHIQHQCLYCLSQDLHFSMNDENCAMRRANGFEACILHAQNLQNKLCNHFITSRSYSTWVCINEVDIILP